jgi:hypothetical protein
LTIVAEHAAAASAIAIGANVLAIETALFRMGNILPSPGL